MYYRKKHDSQTVADKCGIGFLFQSVGDRIHMDDMPGVELLLGMTQSGIDLLFELEDAEEDAIRELDVFFEPFEDDTEY